MTQLPVGHPWPRWSRTGACGRHARLRGLLLGLLGVLQTPEDHHHLGVQIGRAVNASHDTRGRQGEGVNSDSPLPRVARRVQQGALEARLVGVVIVALGL